MPDAPLSIDPGITLIDIVGTLCKYQNTSLPDFATMTLRNQAAALLEVLDTPGKSRLIVLDRFENWLDKAREESPGAEEFLDALNSQVCTSRVLITCRSLIGRRSKYPLVHLKEQHIPAVKTDTHNLIDEIYTKELNRTQRILLSVFSVYRKEIPLAVAQMQNEFTSHLPKENVRLSLNMLLDQRLLQDCGRDRYRVDITVAERVQRHFMNYTSEQERQRALKTVHLNAAQYYCQRLRNSAPE